MKKGFWQALGIKGMLPCAPPIPSPMRAWLACPPAVIGRAWFSLAAVAAVVGGDVGLGAGCELKPVWDSAHLWGWSE